MNLLLLREDDVREGYARVTGRQADHIRRVLKKSAGETLKAGVCRQGRMNATLIGFEDDALLVELGPIEVEPPPRAHLIIALPRPLAVSRLLHTAASFGVSHIDLIAAWRVERSYFGSPRLSRERLTEDLWLGAEQGGHSWVPTLELHPRFRPFVEEHLPNSPWLGGSGRRFVFEPGVGRHLSKTNVPQGELVTFAFGPEGGWIPPELRSWDLAGFTALELHPHVLTTEIAIAASLAQLELVQTLPP